MDVAHRYVAVVHLEVGARTVVIAVLPEVHDSAAALAEDGLVQVVVVIRPNEAGAIDVEVPVVLAVAGVRGARPLGVTYEGRDQHLPGLAGGVGGRDRRSKECARHQSRQKWRSDVQGLSVRKRHQSSRPRRDRVLGDHRQHRSPTQQCHSNCSSLLTISFDYQSCQDGGMRPAAQLLLIEAEVLPTVLEGVEPADFDLPTVCDGWSVRDVIAHCGAALGDLVSGDVGGFTPAENQVQVEERRSWELDAVIGELMSNYAAAAAIIDRIGGAADALGVGEWIHGGEIRDAIHWTHLGHTPARVSSSPCR